MSTASPYHERYSNLESIVGVFLLPGLSVIYMGTELNMTGNMSNVESPTAITSFKYYPMGARSMTYLAGVSKDVFQSAMMPWTSAGASTFPDAAANEEYKRFFGMSQSVEVMMRADEF